MKIKTETQTVTTITLETERERQLFAGLVDFPLHAQQTGEIESFLEQLADAVPYTDAETIGYKDETNF